MSIETERTILLPGITRREKSTLGSHWEGTSFSTLYQLYRRVEEIATQLEKRRRKGWVPSKPYIEELNDIAITLKILDGKLISPKAVRRKGNPVSAK